MTHVDPAEPSDELFADDLLTGLHVVRWEADARTTELTFVSEGAERLLGRPAAEWIGTPGAFASWLHPDDRERTLAAFLSAGAGAPLDLEHRVLALDGRVRWVHTVGRLIEAPPSGLGTRIGGLMIDATAHRAGTADQLEAELRFRRLVERLPAIVYLEAADREGDEPGAMLYVSPQVRDILGFSPQEWIADPTSWVEHFHPDDRQRVRAIFEGVAEGESRFTAEYRMFTSEGAIRWFHDDALLIRDDRGKPLFWQGIMYDITEQREGEALLRDTEARYRTLVEQLPAIVYSEDVTGDGLQVVYINLRVKELLGIEPEEWVADPSVWSAAIHPDDAARVDAINRQTEASGEPFSVEYRMIARDGRTVWFKDEARLVRRADGRPAYWQGVMIDVTSHHQAEAQVADAERDLAAERMVSERLREADALKDTLLQAVSHDLRSPLAAILGLARTLERDDLDLPPAEAHDLAGRIAANARRLDRIVADLLDLERLSAGVLEPMFAPLDLGRLVRELVAGADPVAGRRLHLDTAPLEIWADAAMVERIVENLIRNAVKHTPGGSRIWVRVERVDDAALLVVEDDGPGVPAEAREAIFEPFTQGPTDARSAGLGVGLAVVARFAALHDGRAWVQARDGGGASFRVSLATRPRGSVPVRVSDQPTDAGSASEASQA